MVTILKHIKIEDAEIKQLDEICKKYRLKLVYKDGIITLYHSGIAKKDIAINCRKLSEFKEITE